MSTGPELRSDHHGSLRSSAFRYPGRGESMNTHPVTLATAGTMIGMIGTADEDPPAMWDHGRRPGEAGAEHHADR